MSQADACAKDQDNASSNYIVYIDDTFKPYFA